MGPARIVCSARHRARCAGAKATQWVDELRGRATLLGPQVSASYYGRMHVRLPWPNPRHPVDYTKWVDDTFAVPSTENAADDYLALADEWKEYLLTPDEAEDEERAFEISRQHLDLSHLMMDAEDGPWYGPSFQPVREWLDKKSRALDAFRSASLKRHCYFPMPQPEPPLYTFMNMTALHTCRGAVRHLAAQGWRDAADQRYDTMIANMLTVLRWAHQLQCADLTSRLIPATVAELAYPNLIRVLGLCADPGRLACEYLPQLTDCDPAWPGLGLFFSLERIGSYDFVQRISEWDEKARCARFSRRKSVDWVNAWNQLHYPQFGKRPGKAFDVALDKEIREAEQAAGVKLPRPGILSIAGWEQAGFVETLEALDDFYDALRDWADRPYHLATRATDAYDGVARGIKSAVATALLTGFRGAGADRSAVFSYHTQRDRLERANALQRGTWLVYAIWAHHHVHGSFPATVEELLGSRDPSMLVDPFTGRPLIYRRTAESFTLYSAGSDQRDSGGKHDRNWGVPGWNSPNFGDVSKADGDYVMWPVQ